uniref:Uncharacterized protein n=1 Tax=viral metagenome TaxID=1070528 RepID=A0A6M3J5I7_9ZZZZ
MKCEFCGKKLPKGTKKIFDPYGHEINDDNTLYYICDDCGTLRSEEI